MFPFQDKRYTELALGILTEMSNQHSHGHLYMTQRVAAVGLTTKQRREFFDAFESMRLVQTSFAGETLYRLIDGVVVRVHRRPLCDVCRYGTEPKESKAVADARTANGQWAFVCIEHFIGHGCRLGTGYGQVLVAEEEM